MRMTNLIAAHDGLYVMGRRTVAALEIAIKALEQSTEALAHCYDVVEWPGEGVDSPQWLALKANKHALAEIEKTLQ